MLDVQGITVRTTRRGTTGRESLREAKQRILKTQQQIFPLVSRVISIPLLLVLELSNNFNQLAQLLAKLLLLRFELLHILHQSDQLSCNGITLFEHDSG